MAIQNGLSERRKKRVRYTLSLRRNERLRLSIFRSSNHIYAQIIDDAQNKTLVAASTIDKELRSSLKNGGNRQAASLVGKLVAERAKKAGILAVVFDRGEYIYHGRIQALAEGARENGLQF